MLNQHTINSVHWTKRNVIINHKVMNKKRRTGHWIPLEITINMELYVLHTV